MYKFILIIISLFSAQLFAGACDIHYTKYACEGNEKTSFRTYSGKPSCVKNKEAASADECKALAVKSCANSRHNITKSKVITATFDGAVLKASAGASDFCLEYSKRDAEFNQCGE
ncbi:MAG: hypothetical protein HRU20_04040 [Pseudomonadales bacterium]|nr:hypothetical protein [Pseudomonadales bacterium]